MFTGSIDWTNVLVALIAGLPAIISAVGVLLVHRQVRPPSGGKLGAVVERAHNAAVIAAHASLRAAREPDRGVPPSIPEQEG